MWIGKVEVNREIARADGVIISPFFHVLPSLPGLCAEGSSAELKAWCLHGVLVCLRTLSSWISVALTGGCGAALITGDGLK